MRKRTLEQIKKDIKSLSQKEIKNLEEWLKTRQSIDQLFPDKHEQIL